MERVNQKKNESIMKYNIFSFCDGSGTRFLVGLDESKLSDAAQNLTLVRGVVRKKKQKQVVKQIILLTLNSTPFAFNDHIGFWRKEMFCNHKYHGNTFYDCEIIVSFDDKIIQSVKFKTKPFVMYK